MSRYLYITAAALVAFSLAAFVMTFVANPTQPDLPAGGSMWQTVSLFLLLGALVAAFCGVLRQMFEQVGRRNAERRRREGGSVIEFPGKAGRGAGQEKYSPRDRREK